MDITLAKTFLAVVATGNFQSASSRLFVTQSAVSLRIKKLEEELGREVFVRNKGGAILTPAGLQFERFARSMVKLWEEARYQVAIPAGLESLLIVGCQYSLWPKLGMSWLRMMEAEMPTTSFKAEVGDPNRLLRLMLDGLLDMGIMYTPQLRPGLEVRPLMEDTLVLAATDPDYPPDLDDRYVSIEWSPEFIALHSAHYPHHPKSRINMALGSMAVRFVVRSQRAAYLPARAIEDFIRSGTLHIIGDAPAFPFPSYIVWNPDKDRNLIDTALGVLNEAVSLVSKNQTDLIEEAGISAVDQSLTNSLFEQI